MVCTSTHRAPSSRVCPMTSHNPPSGPLRRLCLTSIARELTVLRAEAAAREGSDRAVVTAVMGLTGVNFCFVFSSLSVAIGARDPASL